MILKITQKIIYEIDGTINFGFNKLLLTPQSNESQKIINWKIYIEGGSKELNSTDQFGNLIDLVSIQNNSKKIEYNIFGRVAGELRDYKKYSKNIKKLGQEGLIWNSETLISFLENPKKYIKGTKMNFKGIKKSDELDALVEYLAASTKIN